MKRQAYALLFVIAVAILVLGCTTAQEDTAQAPAPVTPQSSPADVGTIATDVADGVATVGDVDSGPGGSPVIVLEENHAQRIGQLQLAIVYSRLYERHDLRHIALEGHLDSAKPIDTQWWVEAAAPLDRGHRAEVAAALLSEGEISAAEFTKLVYEDVELVPIEDAAGYSVDISDDAAGAPFLCLITAAMESLSNAEERKAVAIQQEAEDLGGDAASEKIQEMVDYIISCDPWADEVNQKLDRIGEAKAFDLQELIDAMRDIQATVEERNVGVGPEDKQALEEAIRFYEARHAASDTMVANTAALAGRQSVSVVAMNIGTAHAAKVCRQLGEAGLAYAVLAPQDLRDDSDVGEITTEQFELKSRRLSVDAEGFTQLIVDACPPPSTKKPRPVLSEPWLQAKGELYLMADRITRNILGADSRSDYADDALQGRWIHIDPDTIEVVPLDPNTGGGRAVLFPAVINPTDPDRRQEIWVKAWAGQGAASDRDSETVEELLQRLIDRLRSEETDETPDEPARAQISTETFAGIAKTRAAAMKVPPKV